MGARHDRPFRGGGPIPPSLKSWDKPIAPHAKKMKSDVAVEMGWGRLIFGQTFESIEELAELLQDEKPGQRDIALYLRDPHVLLSLAPQELFLDPSHTYRLWVQKYRPRAEVGSAFVLRRIKTRHDAEEVNRIYEARGMVTFDPDFVVDNYATKLRTYWIAEDQEGGIVGTVTGVDHKEAFNDPENGTSLWCLAVDPQANAPGVGEALVRQLAEHYFARGRDYVDLSVMHDNKSAIRLYEKLGFERVPVFCVKHKNPINEPLFIAPALKHKMNPYAEIITNEARRRGINVEVLESEFGLFRLTYGGRSVNCRESLSDLTNAVSFIRCDDKRLTHRCLEKAGLNVPAQRIAGGATENREFLEQHGSVVVKPARGEQGVGVSVDVSDPDEMHDAIAEAARTGAEVILEQYVKGEDLRVIVIDDAVVAAALRRPPEICGNGKLSIKQLIEKYNRRRRAATGGESAVPLDKETQRVLAAKGFDLDAVLPEGEVLRVRKTANLHTGGTIHDVTDEMHSTLAEASVEAARALDIPVVGLDLAVPDHGKPDYFIIEANERPGLANHEPQPTAEKFIDLLFPQTISHGRV